MQYAENGSMLDLIRKYRNIHEDIARKYFRQLISAIDYCHNQGIVHRYENYFEYIFLTNSQFFFSIAFEFFHSIIPFQKRYQM